MTRITGLATGLDVDTIVKQTMQAYQSKIDTQKQKKDVVEIKQQLYRDIIKEAQELYNKHFDVLKEGSLIKSSTWQSVTFKSDSNSLTVTGSSSSKLGNYTVEKGQIAKAAYITKTSDQLGNEITINGQVFKVTGANDKEKADNLNKALTKAGVNVSVKYTNFANTDPNGNNKSAFVFESKILGVNSNFIIGGAKENLAISKGENATGAQITGLKVEQFKSDAIDNKVSFKIDSTEIIIDIAEGNENSQIESILNDKLKDSNYTVEIDKLGNITLTTKKTGLNQLKPQIIEIGATKISENDITFIDGKNAISPKDINIGQLKYTDKDKNKISINGVYINLENIIPKEGSATVTVDKKINYINDILKANSVSVTASKNESGDIILKSDTVGENSKIEFFRLNNGEFSNGGQDAEITISDGTGTNTYKGISNTFTLDGVTFKFTGEIPSGGISVTSEQDSSKIVENIKKYIEDYNSLIVKINTLTSEKRDRNYEPLTEAQKEEMSDKEIELWEAKVKQGQLRRDSDLMRISNALKQGMKSMVSGSGLTLESIGIESVQDYGGTKDGTFKIDETKLKEAIENNIEEVSKLFTQTSNSTTSDVYNQKGIMTRLKEILYDETVSSKSSLAKKVGFEGTTTVVNNTLTKQMEAYQKKIDEMKSLFSDKEQALYTKYSKLETIMNNYNNQMTYLSQALGLG